MVPKSLAVCTQHPTRTKHRNDDVIFVAPNPVALCDCRVDSHYCWSRACPYCEVLRIEPEYTIEGTQARLTPFKRPEDAEHFFDGLRKAGLPE